MSFSLVGPATNSSSSSSSSSSAGTFSATIPSASASSTFPSFASSSMTASSTHFQPSSSSSNASLDSLSSTGLWGAATIKVLMGGRGPGKPSLCEDVAIRILGFLKPQLFGAAEWQRFFGVDVGPEPELPDTFYSWWFWGQDAVEPGKKNYETHLPPILRPQRMTGVTETGAEVSFYCSLNTLGRLVQHPKQGPSSKYSYNSTALRQHGSTRAGPARWLVMREGLLARGQPDGQMKEYMRRLNTKAGADYDEMPSGLDLVAIVFVTYVRTNGHDRHLGDGTGKEKRWSNSCCKETVLSADPFPTTNFPTTDPITVGSFSSKGLNIGTDKCHYGVVALRKF